jgi:CheY-like chemotaxis protein
MDASGCILVIEDSKHLAFVLTELLQSIGLEVVTAHDGREGLALANERSPRLILSDYNLPEKTGLDVLIHLQKDEATSGIPFVLVTAHGNAGLRDECLMAGAEAVLFKPFSAEELFAVIDPFLQQKA